MGARWTSTSTWAVLRHFRRFDEYAEQQARAEWQVHRPRGHEDFTVGVMGLGVLGTHVARALLRSVSRCTAGARARKLEGVRSFAGAAERDAFLAGSRALVLMLPHTPDTEGMLNRRDARALPRGAYVINVARGGLIVDEDLLAALDSGHIAGATLDVFNEEPLSPAHPYWCHPKVVHHAACSAVTLMEESVAQVAAKIRRIERGEGVSGVVDLARGY